MTQPGQYPDAPRRGPEPLGVPGSDSATGPGRTLARLRPAFLALIAAVAASAVLGLLVGLIWSAVAPRALLVVQSRGVAYVVNSETSAFIDADAWFCLLTAVGGVICGTVGYLLAVRRYGATALAGLVLGGVAASVLAMWVGQQQGLASFRVRLAVSPPGTRLREPLALGGHGALAFWPLFVGLVVGSIEVVSQSIEHKRKEAAVEQPPPARAEGGGVSGIDPVG
jgi:hypothetical protein